MTVTGVTRTLIRIERVISQANEWLGRGVSWLTLAMALVTFLIVVLRKGFDVGWIWMQESVVYLHSTAFLLAVGFALGRGAHVRIDIAYRRMSAKMQAVADVLGVVVLLLPTCWIIYSEGRPYVAASWQVSESSPEPGGLAGVYLLKTMLLLYAALLALQGIALIIDRALILTDRRCPNNGIGADNNAPNDSAADDSTPDELKR